MRRVISVLGAVAVTLTGAATGALAQQCDFLTAGGYIINNEAKANFGVGGSCKPGGDGHGLWGHLQYKDHGTGLDVHWTTITGYFACSDPSCGIDPAPDSASSQPTGTRLICGTARTNLPFPDDTVDWAVRATDKGEPGKNNDLLGIQIVSQKGSFAYSADVRTLAGGNTQLHKPNNSTGFFGAGPDSTNCPAFFARGPGECPDGQTFNPSTGMCECPPGTHFDPGSGCVPD